jgi:hypothetical protein
MYRAMLQTQPMNLAPWPLANHLIAIIYYVKYLFRHG